MCQLIHDGSDQCTHISTNLARLIQAGANKCRPRPKFAKVIWTNIDSGANIHISNCSKTVANQKPCDKLVDQADGTGSPASATGNWTFWLGNRFVRSRGTYLMPKNPTCTIGSAALKLFDGYVNTHHDQFNYATYVHADGTSFSFTKENKLLRTINALDYVPLIFYMSSIPDEHVPLCKQVQLRRSNRTRKPTVKMKSYQLIHNKSVSTPSVPLSHSISSPKPPSKIKTSQQIDKKSVPTLSVLPSQSIATDRAISFTQTNSNQNIVEKDQSLPSDDLPQSLHIDSNTNNIVFGQLSSLIIHLKFGCRNHKSLRHMHLSNSLEHMPKVSLPRTPCPICLIVKNTRLPKNKETNMPNFKPGQLMMMDFGYFSTTSIRGYCAYFSVTCQATGYGYIFPVPNKRPPLSLIAWITETMKRIDRQIYFVRFDEGGELARSQQVCQLLTSLNIVMQTTGGYASSLLGKDERQHRTLAEMITSMLYTANLDPKYWCFAAMYSIYVKRRWCNYPDSTTPYEKWYGTKPDFKNIHIFGAPVTITEENGAKEKPRNHIGRFLGFGSSSAVVIYEDIKSGKLKRARNCRIDNYFSLATTHPSLLCPASQLIQAASQNISPPLLSKDLPLLEFIPSPFQQHELYTYDVTIQSSGPLGVVLEDDEHFGLPVIVSMAPNSCFSIKCKKQLRRQAWLINIHHEEPITVNHALEYIKFLRQSNILTFRVTLSKRVTTQKSNYEELRSRFDNIRPITSKATISLSQYSEDPHTYLHLSPAAKYAVYSNSKPKSPKDWKELSEDDLREYWIKGIFERFLHNYNAGLWSAPTLRKNLPDNAVILKLVSVFKVKQTDVPNIWDLYYRPCANGGPMIQGLHFDQSYCPTSGYSSLRIILCLSSVFGLVLYMLDVHNAFQCRPLPENEKSPPIYVTMPPLYLKWFQKSHPKYELDPKEKYVLQMFMNMQGNKQASRGFYKLLTKMFATIGLFPLSVDSAIFAMSRRSNIIIVSVQTDDLLLATNSIELKDDVLNTLLSAFQITTQEGIILNYLNFRIIQSSHGVSIDQTTHIQDLVNTYIPKDTKLQQVDTPLRADRQFQTEVANSFPASPNELKGLEQEFGFKFSSLYGALLHVSSSSRPDLSNAINRLGIFQSGPNRLAFQSLLRCVQYLRSHPNVPLMYTRLPFTTETNFQTHFSKASPDSYLRVPHCLCGHVDSSFAPFKESRHSITGCIETLGSTAIGWKTTKQLSCSTSATEAETRAYYLETKRIRKLRTTMQQIGVRLRDASPILASFVTNFNSPTPIFEDNKGTRDMLDAQQTTSNLKHLDVPLTYVHEQHENSVILCLPCKSEHMFADTMTKQETGPKHLQARDWYVGKKFYPPVNSKHYQLLTKTCPLN